MKDLDEHGRMCEESLGMISFGMIWGLHAICERAGSKWQIDKPETMEIVITKKNAYEVYSWCRAIREGFSVGLSKEGMKLIRAARLEAHKYLVDEANDPNTTIERKIELVKLTSKNQ